MGTSTKLILNFKYAFRPHKPRLVVRLVSAVIKSYLFRRPPLRYVDFAIDFACNLRCNHCFATALNHPGRRKMAIEDYARVAAQCMEAGTVNFSFQGGEPLLSPQLGEIIAACKPNRNLISVTTNGTLLDKEHITALKQYGVDILTISLDSAIAEEHDRFRGVPGVFEKTMAGIKRVLDAGLKVTLGTVVTRGNVKSDGIAALAELAERLKVILYFIMPVPAGRWIQNSDIFLSAGDLAYIDCLTQSSPYLRTDFQANFGPYGCGAAKEILYLTPYGDVLPCPFLHISMGNIFEEPIMNIRQRALRNPYFNVYKKTCLASTDEDFIKLYLSKTFEADRLPIPWGCVFNDDSEPQS